MSEQTYLLSFEEISEAEANQYAEELREALLDASDAIAVQRQSTLSATGCKNATA